MHHGMGWRNRPAAQAAERDGDRIGIRANQLDSGASPTPCSARAAPKWQPADVAQGSDTKQPFALAERLADNTIARSKAPKLC
jgi:hypothetical protein